MSPYGTPYDRALRGYIRPNGTYGSTFDRSHLGYLVLELVVDILTRRRGAKKPKQTWNATPEEKKRVIAMRNLKIMQEVNAERKKRKDEIHEKRMASLELANKALEEKRKKK